ncbi:MAG: redox-sensing transcriptional repressor Rex [Oscillospiraceae bacterium]|nr:redox-sensing transcriptional repressor Rex [Oscillospiraceae bacterium]
MKRQGISNNVIRRLPQYLRKLDDLTYKGVERISSSELGVQMGLTPSQIRQDFFCFGEFGQQGYGYNVRALRAEIANILGMDRDYSVILVGVGHIGQSLIQNFDFSRYGFRFMGAFEIRKELVGTEIAGSIIMDAEYQDEFIRQKNIDIAILSVQKRRAQAVTNRLVRSGIRAIWNFTDVHVDAGDPNVIVEDIYFLDSLLSLSYRLSIEDKSGADKHI